ncbi:MAG: 3-oxoacyl-ACP reductase FabG [Acidiferrobacterales bacterium]
MTDSSARVALVTGASRGIGRTIAVQLAKDGYDIAFCCQRSVEAAQKVAEEISQQGRRVHWSVCDVADFEQVQKFMVEAEEALGPLHAVVNNAGIIQDGSLVRMDPQAWRNVISANLDSVFNVCRNVIFSFLKRKSGCIVNISSVAGVHGTHWQTNYSASKAGIIGFSKALSKEVGPYGIRVNTVAPGFIETDMTQGMDAKLIEAALGDISLRHFGHVQDVADLVSFLVSDRARYITGQTVLVDGGLVI